MAKLVGKRFTVVSKDAYYGDEVQNGDTGIIVVNPDTGGVMWAKLDGKVNRAQHDGCYMFFECELSISEALPEKDQLILNQLKVCVSMTVAATHANNSSRGCGAAFERERKAYEKLLVLVGVEVTKDMVEELLS